MEKIKERFLKAYSNLPDIIRGEILVVVDDKTYSWNSAYFEIKNNSKIGEVILKTLDELDII
ncbi:hypothetical protein J4474_02595 [Candidatus Pacearchaeota archaeon]|nr:hypothetical protein [Candidatus Pacearchaeota archaeon]